MGYTTEFEGSFTITPALPTELIDQLNEFCSARHEGTTDPHTALIAAGIGDLNRPYTGPLHDTGGIGIWCDWAFMSTPDGATTLMGWNGNEKSYDMDVWGQFILAHHIPTGHTVTGTITAAGEDPDDQWRMVANGRSINSQEGTVTYK